MVFRSRKSSEGSVSSSHLKASKVNQQTLAEAASCSRRRTTRRSGSDHNRQYKRPFRSSSGNSGGGGGNGIPKVTQCYSVKTGRVSTILRASSSSSLSSTSSSSSATSCSSSSNYSFDELKWIRDCECLQDRR